MNHLGKAQTRREGYRATGGVGENPALFFRRINDMPTMRQGEDVIEAAEKLLKACRNAYPNADSQQLRETAKNAIALSEVPPPVTN
jgi:ATP phosphoribosyltransferase regulatory subunit HisZ